MNKLQHSSSPYLLQHKDNPVHWWPWEEEAFAQAAEADKPVFVSIGYSTCHWCHVMAHESFEDPDVAALMNEAFVNIKVDREERPDVDTVYMNVCQMMTGRGGWPLTLILTPDKRPFYAATYLPKHSRGQRMGMVDLIPAIQTAWEDRRRDIEASADELTQALRHQQAAFQEAGTLRDAWTRLAAEQLGQRYDPEFGGFGRAPKFPSPHQLLFLERAADRFTAEQATYARGMVRTTLQAMRDGGVFDQVGFGLHRYSTDRQWKLPHFEKMLYDQAMLILACVEAYATDQQPAFRLVADEIVRYVDEQLTSPDGAFYSAEDADSEGEEGRFYVWTTDELAEVLPESQRDVVVAYYGVEGRGNFEDEATGRRTGANVLYRAQTLDAVAEGVGASVDVVAERLEAARLQLKAVREQRPRPGLDDKVLCDWNGLMVAALAQAGRVFGDAAYLARAEGAAAWCVDTFVAKEGRLLHRYRAGEVGLQANLDDYAFLGWGLLNLYDATADVAYLDTATAITNHMVEQFADEETGGFFFTPADGEALIARPKIPYDGAVPAGQAVAVANLLRLSHWLGRPQWADLAEDAIRLYADTIDQHPSEFTSMILAQRYLMGAVREVVLVGRSAEALEPMRALVQDRRDPLLLVHVKVEGSASAERLSQLAPFTGAHAAIEGQPTAYVCEQQQCQLPVTSLDALAERLAATSSS